MIEIKDVTKKYGEKCALDNINLKLPDTGFVVIEGKNGSGKSTLINLIGTLDTPTTGKITIDGYELTDKTEKELYKYREETVGFIFQDNNLFENMTVRENINIVGTNEAFDKIVKYLEIEELLDKKAKKLSGGEQQRVAIARALLKHPKIVLADEPTSAIDTDTKGNILGSLKAMSKHNLVIVVSHDIETVQKYADIIISMKQGRIINEERITPVLTSENKALPFKNKFSPKNFTFSNLFTNKKQILRNCILLIISFLFIMIASAISSLDFIDMQVDTMDMENDYLIILKNTSQSQIYIPEEAINKLDNKLIQKEYLYIGKGIYNNNNQVIKFEINYKKESDKEVYHELSFFPVDALSEVSYGKKPERANEVVISSYLADQMIKYGVLDKNEEYYYPKDYESLILDKKELKLENNFVIISGITDLQLDKYTNKITKSKIENEGFNIYTLNGFYALYKTDIFSINPEYMFSNQKYAENGAITLYKNKKVFTSPVELQDGTYLSELNQNEIIISKDALKLANINEYDCINQKITFHIFKDFANESKTLTATIKGISNNNEIYFNLNDVKPYLNNRININKIEIRQRNKKDTKKILNSYLQYNPNNDFFAKTNYSSIYEDLKAMYMSISFIFFITAIGLIIVSIISLFNYISNTIDENKKEIALQKSLGIPNKDILMSYSLQFVILLTRAYICGLVCFLITRLIINHTIYQIYQFKTNFVPINFFLLSLIILLTIIIGMIIFLIIFIKIKKTSPQVLLKDTII